MEVLVEGENRNCGDWLRRVWEYYDRKESFDLEVADWINEIPDIMQLIREDAKKHRIRMISLAEYGDLNADGIPQMVRIRIPTSTFRELEPPKRQVTVGGKVYDTRNGINQEIMNTELKHLATILVPCWIQRLNDIEAKVRHGADLRLQKTVALRPELETSYPEAWKQLQEALINRFVTHFSNGGG